MLRITSVSRRFGGRTVLDRVSLSVGAGECAALVGPNGCGKTTLLRIIAGEDRPDSGVVEVAPGRRLGYLRQGYAETPALTAGQAFPALYVEDDGDSRLAGLAVRMAGETDSHELARLADAYAEALAAVEAPGRLGDLPALRQQLRLREVAADEPVAVLSGGEQTKLGLLNLVAQQPDILLLDEPTNNLDLVGQAWLGDYLDRFGGAVLLVSHDRAFLDDHATVILELDPATGRVEAFPGNYSDYRDEKARRGAEQWQRYIQQQQRERRVRAEIRSLKGRAQRTERLTVSGPSADFYRARAAGVARRAKVIERRLTRQLESAEHVDKPVRQPFQVRATIDEGQRAGARMLAAEGLTIAAGGQVLLEGVNLLIGWGERVALLGPNGSGKTSLLRAILGSQPPAAGAVKLGPSVQIGYLPQGQQTERQPAAGSSTRSGAAAGGSDHLDHPATTTGRATVTESEISGTVDPAEATPLAVIRRATTMGEAEARRFLHRFLFTSDQVFTPLERLSYGERRRLALAQLVVAGANLLILDEPTNHLDIQSREAFEAALEDYHGAILAVTHDRYFIERFAGRVLMVEEGRLVEV